MKVVPLAGIEPALLAELDFEFERVYQFRHRGITGQSPEAARIITCNFVPSIAAKAGFRIFDQGLRSRPDGRAGPRQAKDRHWGKDRQACLGRA